MTGFEAETSAGVRGAFSKIGKLVGISFGAIIGVEAIKSAVSAAASIQKQVEVINFEFGKAGQGLIKFADTTGVALGDTNRSTDEASAKFGLLFKSLGVGHAAASQMTLGFEKLALSVNAIRGGGGQGAATMLNQIVLAAAGNTRGLKQMGIVVDATSEKLAAFRLGLIQNLTQALTPAQKTEAIYAIATAHLGQTMELAKKHSGDLANVTARLSAEWMLAKERIGKALMPAVTSFLNFLMRAIPPVISMIMRVFGDLKTTIVVAFDALRPIFAPIVAGLQSIYDAFKGGGGITAIFDRIKASFEKLTPAMKVFAVAVAAVGTALAVSFLGPITGLIALSVAFGEAYRHSARFRAIIGDIGAFVRARLLPPLREAATAIVHVFDDAIKVVMPIFTRFFDFVKAHKTVFEVLAAAIGGGLIGALILLAVKFAAVRNAFVTAFNFIRPYVLGLVGVFKTLGAAVVSGASQAAPLFQQLGSTIKTVFQDAITIIKPFAQMIGVVLVANIKALQFVWNHFGKTIVAVVKGAFTIIIGDIRGALMIIKGVFDVFAGLLSGNWGKLWAGLKEIFHGFTTAVVASLKTWGGIVLQFFRDLWHTIEKIVLEGIDKVVHLLAKIPTGFNVFGQHFGFTNPFVGWDSSLKNTIAGLGQVKKATSDIQRGAAARSLQNAAASASKVGAGLAGAKVKQQVAALDAVFTRLTKKFANSAPAVRKAADAQINGLRRQADALVAAFDKGRITFAQFEKSLGNLAQGKTLANLKSLGAAVGSAITTGAAAGLTAAQKQALGITKQLSDSYQNAVQAAQKAIQSSIQSAKNNLDKIGQDLAKSIMQIQAKLGGAAGAIAGSPQGQAFAKLKKLIESGAPSFEIQRAQAALSNQLKNVGKTQQTQVQTQLANLTAAFNQGKIGYKEFESRLHKILREDGITMGAALKAGGSAFRDAVRAQIQALGKQAQAIAAIPAKYRGIGGAGGAADIKIIRPLEVIRNENMRIAVAAQKQRDAQLKATQKTNAILAGIKQQGNIGGLPGYGKTPHGRRSHAARRHARTGGR